MKSQKTAPISFRMDEKLKKQTEETLEEIGLTMSSAITMFAKAVVRTGTIPFDLTIDPFYKAENQEEIARRIEEYESGKTKMVEITMEELEVEING